MLYFSYGSNMSIARMKSRLPSAEFLAVATLCNHRLKFHKISNKDNSGKCDAAYTGNPIDQVIGVVFNIPEGEKPNLDKLEGLGSGYNEKEIEVYAKGGQILSAFTYYATDIDESKKPYTWYKHHVLVGARENNFPNEYVTYIENTKATVDTNKAREATELSIYK